MSWFPLCLHLLLYKHTHTSMQVMQYADVLTAHCRNANLQWMQVIKTQRGRDEWVETRCREE